MSAVSPIPSQVADASPASDTWAILKAVAETAVLFGFFLSVIGWSYLASYYSIFGFRPLELDISSPVVTLFAVSALSRSALLLLAIAILILVLRFFRISLPRIGGSTLLLVLLVATLVLYQLGSFLGRRTALQDVWDTSSRLPSVAIFLRNSKLGYPSCASATTPNVDCRLLLHHKGSYYLIKPFSREQGSGTAAAPNGNLDIYAVPDSEVLLVQYERGVK